MDMRICPGNVLLVELQGQTRAYEEFDDAVRRVRNQEECDVIVDFENVTILTSRSLTPLMHLRDLVKSRRRRLLLCSLNQADKGVFSVTGLDRIFEIVDDRSSAMAALETQLDDPLVERIGNSGDGSERPTGLV